MPFITAFAIAIYVGNQFYQIKNGISTMFARGQREARQYQTIYARRTNYATNLKKICISANIARFSN